MHWHPHVSLGGWIQIPVLPERFQLIAPSGFAEHVTAALHAGKTVLALMKIVLRAWSVDRGAGSAHLVKAPVGGVGLSGGELILD